AKSSQRQEPTDGLSGCRALSSLPEPSTLSPAAHSGAIHARRKRDPYQDRELQEHAEDHEGDGDGRREQDAQSAGPHARISPVRGENSARDRSLAARESGFPASVSDRKSTRLNSSHVKISY